MRKIECFIALLLVLSIVTLAFSKVSRKQRSDSVDFNNPVRDASKDEVTKLPGLKDPINFKHYSGYLRADVFDFAPSFLHYWFVESQGNPSKDPVLLWLTGGPGFSSLSGFLLELGPFRVKSKTKELELNEYSWNKHANIIFLESPAEVGFSYSPTNRTLKNTEHKIAKGNYQALKAFMKKFPQFKKNRLYLSGQSLAGVFLPTLGLLVDADPELNFHGVAIGSGYLDTSKIDESLIYFLYHHGLIGETAWKGISEKCCNSRPPCREFCRYSGPGTSPTCIYAYLPISKAISESGMNPYGLYNECVEESSERNEIIQRTQDPKSFTSEFISGLFKNFKGHGRNETGEPSQIRTKGGYPCIGFNTLTEYLNDRDVRIALHIPDRFERWVDAGFRSAFLIPSPDREGGLSPQVKKLIDSKRNLTLLLYNGDTDLISPFLGNEWFADDLGRKVERDYESWRVDGRIGGYYKVYDGIVFATVKGAGHMVPKDRPKEAFKMINSFFDAKGHDIRL